MKIDAPLMTYEPAAIARVAREREDAGYHGLFTAETQHDPFLPLAIAAGATEQIELQTVIAVAFARNPMLLANIGHDLQLYSRGRFSLGLGSQIRPHIENRFSMTRSRPAARMRELMVATRAIWRSWEDGEPLNFRGDFYRRLELDDVRAKTGQHPATELALLAREVEDPEADKRSRLRHASALGFLGRQRPRWAMILR
jgi:alkanesulfonate monooxygenase SsuD/methylene tetrahydromethanopterin reductase-like flavin-dependent oxidoreductase (luciferase family)